jgi:hypothetical protein
MPACSAVLELFCTLFSRSAAASSCLRRRCLRSSRRCAALPPSLSWPPPLARLVWVDPNSVRENAARLVQPARRALRGSEFWSGAPPSSVPSSQRSPGLASKSGMVCWYAHLASETAVPRSPLCASALLWPPGPSDPASPASSPPAVHLAAPDFSATRRLSPHSSPSVPSLLPSSPPCSPLPPCPTLASPTLRRTFPHFLSQLHVAVPGQVLLYFPDNRENWKNGKNAPPPPAYPLPPTQYPGYVFQQHFK